MEKTDHQSETRDFMNVETFSQLPFVRPAPVKEKANIRLFGKEFGEGDSNSNDPHEELAELFPDTNTREDMNENNGKSSRKFECHYCCRNFPTSQALGGHQNAHKRERQHAKRLHLQSAMVHNAISDHPHLYGVMNYPLGSASAPAYNISWTSYNSNSSYSTTNNGFYGHYGSSYSRPPTNGSPLALWRIPPVRTSTALRRDHSSTHHLPLFSKQSSISGSDSQSRFDYESKRSMQDHISLDLHL